MKSELQTGSLDTFSGRQHAWSLPYSATRSPVRAANTVTTSHPLATQAGLQALRSGGNAIDAVLSAAITLTVVEPTANGVGADAFALFWDGSKLRGLNASGRSPAAWNPERFAKLSEMPGQGWESVTVPGAVSAWQDLSREHGRLPFAALFEAAIHYAREGFPVTPIVSKWWRRHDPQGPLPGQIHRSSDLARSLEEIAATNGDSFYRGNLAQRIAQSSLESGGALRLEDLQQHQADWVEPLALPYDGLHVHELPPNGQGILVLIALGILDRLNIASLPIDSPSAQHLIIEAVRAALQVGKQEIADPGHLLQDPAFLLKSYFLDGLASSINKKISTVYQGPGPRQGGTVYLAAADSEGHLISYIQSNFLGFGSGITVPGTGISLQSRGAGFNLEPGHPNQVGPRKRPFHTIIPGFITQQGRPLAAFGVMGGILQAQAQVQVLLRILHGRHNIQEALDAPRWEAGLDGSLRIEPGFDPAFYQELESYGHRLERLPTPLLGGGQVIWNHNTHYEAASDARKDGHAAGF